MLSRSVWQQRSGALWSAKGNRSAVASTVGVSGTTGVWRPWGAVVAVCLGAPRPKPGALIYRRAFQHADMVRTSAAHARLFLRYVAMYLGYCIVFLVISALQRPMAASESGLVLC